MIVKRSSAEKKIIVNRLNRIKGQINGIEKMVDGYYWDYVITPDGAKGYVSRNYLRDSNGNIPSAYTAKVEVEIKKEEKEIYVTPNAGVDDIKAEANQNLYMERADGSGIDSSIAKTGDRVWIDNVMYTVVKMGDCSGDGNVKASDYLMIKDFIMGTGTAKLEDVYKKADDVKEDSEIKASDYLKIKDYIMYGVEI